MQCNWLLGRYGEQFIHHKNNQSVKEEIKCEENILSNQQKLYHEWTARTKNEYTKAYKIFRMVI